MSNIRCGTLQKSSKEGYEFVGKIAYGAHVRGDLVLCKARRAGGDGSPDFDVYFTSQGSEATIHAGAAWIKNGNRIGDFFSMSLDNPDWPGPVNVTAFPPDQGQTEWTIVWSRPRGERVQQQVAA